MKERKRMALRDRILHQTGGSAVVGAGANQHQLQQQQHTTTMKSFDLWSVTDRSNKIKEPVMVTSPEEAGVVGVQRVMRSYVLLGQCYGLFPVYGTLSDHPDHLTFSWKSTRAVCSLLVLGVYACMAALQVVHSVKRATLDFKTIDNMVGYGLYVVTLALVLVQASNWPGLVRRWHAVEQRMVRFPPARHLERTVRLYVATFVVGTILLGAARVTSNATALYSRCTHDPLTLAHMTLIAKFKSAVRLVGYSPPALAGLALLALFLHQNTVMVFDELTIAVLPLCLAHRFRQLYRHMRRHDGRRMPIAYWAEMRETYNQLSVLAKHLEDHLTSLTFITIGSNLYFICSLLLSSLHRSNSAWANVSIVYLLVFTIVRTFVASLAAATLYEQSKKPLSLIFSVPTESYSTEVVRFQMQVTHGEITITGCNFFALTRSFILTVAGTIITYEIVLLQFGSDDDETAETAPTTFKSSTCTLLANILNNQ